MTSLFDTDGRRRREATPWARVNLPAFMREMSWNGEHSAQQAGPPVTLTLRYRHAVSTREWWTLEWTGEDGERHTAESQDFDLVLWRAAELEIRARANQERQEASDAE